MGQTSRACQSRGKKGTDSIFSESVLTSDQRVLVLKCAAALQGEIPCVWNDKVASYPLSFNLTPLLMILIPLSSCVLSAALVICSLRDKNRKKNGTDSIFSESVLTSDQRVLVLKRTAVFSVNGFMILNGRSTVNRISQRSPGSRS